MKRLIVLLTMLVVALADTHAVLKERDLEKTLEILRQELTEFHHDLSDMTSERKQQNEQIFGQLMETMKQSGQNALMLYSHSAARNCPSSTSWPRPRPTLPSTTAWSAVSRRCTLTCSATAGA